MLKSILLSSLLFFSQQTNAANYSSEDYSYSESIDSESISSSEDELDTQDFLEERRLLDVISVKLWEIYAAQKKKLGMANSETKIKTAWLITMRVVVPRTANLAAELTNESLFHKNMDFFKIIRCLDFSLRTKEVAGYRINARDFDIDKDASCSIALEVADKMSADLFVQKEDLLEKKLKPTAALIKAYNFLLSNIDNIVEPIFSASFENLPAQIQFHPFRDDKTLIQFYESYFSGLGISEFRYIAPYLVSVVPVAVFTENHRSLSVCLLALCLWPTAKQWKIAQNDKNSTPRVILFDESFFSVLLKLIEIEVG